jgi:hypothetical protein
LTRDCGFAFEDVAYDKVQIWHESKDANVAIGGMREIAMLLPHSVLAEYDDTHFTIGNHFEEITEYLIPKAAATTVKMNSDVEKND